MTMPKWPYTAALVSALLGCLGFAVAPFSGIAYLLALPGLLVAAWWTVSHRAPHRIELTTAAAILGSGLTVGVLAVWGPSWEVLGLASDALFVTILVLPLPALVLALTGAAAGLGRAVTQQRATRTASAN